MASASTLHPDLSALIGRLREGTTTALDPRQPDDRRAIEAFLEIANKRSDRYPALHAAMDREDCGASADPEELRVVDAGRTAGAHRATARAWHAPPGGAYLSGATTLALDLDSREVLASGSGTQVGGSFADAPTATGEAAEAGEGLAALALFHSQSTPEAAPRFGATLCTRPDLPSVGGMTITPHDPKQTTNPNLVIAVGRTPAYQSCAGTDYCYYQQNSETPLLLVPFTGEVTNLPSPIAEPQNLRVETKLYVENTAQPILQPYEAPALAKISAVAGATSLSWKYGYDQDPNNRWAEKTESLKYGPAQKASEMKVVRFWFQFSVPVEDQSQSPKVFSVCSKGLETPSETCAQVPEIKYYWHCLAAGTQVVLEDGSELAIEEVSNLVRVRTGLGGSLGVEATTRGVHQIADVGGYPETFLRLTTEGGRELTLSALHPVMTPGGPLAARDLAPGDEVLGAEGIDTVAACEPSSYEGLVCNLVLVDAEDRARGLDAALGTFVANGLVVGDHDVLTAHYDSVRYSLDYMLPRLPEANHTDYESALAEIAAAR